MQCSQRNVIIECFRGKGEGCLLVNKHPGAIWVHIEDFDCTAYKQADLNLPRRSCPKVQLPFITACAMCLRAVISSSRGANRRRDEEQKNHASSLLKLQKHRQRRTAAEKTTLEWSEGKLLETGGCGGEGLKPVLFARNLTLKSTVMKQNKGLHDDLKPKHKKTTNRTTISPATNIDSREPTIRNRLRRERSSTIIGLTTMQAVCRSISMFYLFVASDNIF